MSKSAFTDAHKIVVDVLTKARRESGLLQVELAAKIGKHQSYISNIERGQRRIDVLEFYAIAKALNIDPAELFRSLSDRLPANVAI